MAKGQAAARGGRRAVLMLLRPRGALPHAPSCARATPGPARRGLWGGGERDVSNSASSSLQSKGNVSLLGNRKLFIDTHALEIALQQVMSHIGGVKKDMIILEKSEFSALLSENEKIKLELQQVKKQVTDEVTKVRADNKLNLNLEKSRAKELYSINERKLLEMRKEIEELHAQQDRALTQTDRKIDTEVADLKTMLESHKLDHIKYLAGSIFTCLTVALGFYRLWI
ncbi:mitochondrial calcium uniporter regulator 1 isoform X3 [Cuculus canorus]|uniref:mitochondrial calcium uniporter regulator 1 isoform X3 n=1 Tax=Cuculus canorus TaxID=55661 RepID=UPI0023AA31AF|nr:mitochondrial calcium uniporter regulator 1 isoform X3 [Cuculus canorus]